MDKSTHHSIESPAGNSDVGQGCDLPSRLACRECSHPLGTVDMIPVRGCRVHSLVNMESLLELRSESSLNVLLVTTIGFSGIRSHNSLHANYAL